MTLLEIAFQRSQAKRMAYRLLDKAAAEFRALTVAEQVHFDTLISRVHELDAALAQRQSLRKAAL